MGVLIGSLFCRPGALMIVMADFFFCPEYDILLPFTLYSGTYIPSDSLSTIIFSLGDPVFVRADFQVSLSLIFTTLCSHKSLDSPQLTRKETSLIYTESVISCVKNTYITIVKKIILFKFS